MFVTRIRASLIDSKMQYAVHRVPMDYKNHSKGVMVLGLRKLASVSKNRKGTVLLNPGQYCF